MSDRCRSHTQPTDARNGIIPRLSQRREIPTAGVAYGGAVRREIVCEGCGETVTVDLANNGVTLEREPAEARAPGRVTISVRQARVHQCADGSYLPPDQQATAERS